MAASISRNVAVKPCEEVVIITTYGVEDQNWNVGAWDARTGNLLQSFKNGSAVPNSLCMIGGECLLAASHTKPVIHIWNMLRQSQKHRKLICGSKVSCLTVTPDGYYIAAGIEDKIHLWQVSTGELYSVLSYSSVEVKCLKFSPSGEHLVSGYRDGTLAVWELQDSLYIDHMRVTDHKPVNTFLGHAGEITALHISILNQVTSAAMDFTVRIWNLFSKEELKVFELGAPVSSIAVDHTELTLYCGDVNGNVYCIDLHYQPAERSVHVDTREANEGFISHQAHRAAVTCMCLTQDQSRLITASDDKTVKIWSMMSFIAPLTITLNDRISNLMVVPTPLAMVFPDRKPQRIIGNLKRHLHGTEGEDSDDGVYVNLQVQQKVPRLTVLSSKSDCDSASLDESQISNSSVTSQEVESLKQKAVKLKKANEEMYQFALKEIMK